MSDDLFAFRFRLTFDPTPLAGGGGRSVNLCGGAFAECNGLEATMEQKVIREGGRTYGAAQRAGPVSFATVVLKRGISPNGDLFRWFAKVSQREPGYRLTVRIDLHDAQGKKRMTWELVNALPVKFKAADFNARATDVGIEELHLAHEGLQLVG
jgi:phage tail-like protein